MFTGDAFLRAFALVQGDEPVLGEEIWIRRRGPVKYAYASPWNGFISNPDPNSLITAAHSKGCWALTFTSDVLMADGRLHELAPVPTPIVFPGYNESKKVRWSLRKAEKTRFEVHDSSAHEIQAVFLSLWERIGRRVPPDFYRILEDSGHGRTLRASKNGEVASGLFYLVDESKVHYMYSLATAPKFKGTDVTTFLVHSFLERAFAEGAPFVDLCGCSVESIYRFKSQFTSEIRFRPRYIAVLRTNLWRLIKWRVVSMYSGLPAHIPVKNDWRTLLVPNVPVRQQAQV